MPEPPSPFGANRITVVFTPADHDETEELQLSAYAPKDRLMDRALAIVPDDATIHRVERTVEGFPEETDELE